MAYRILVVDEEEPIRRLLKRFLEAKGYEVALACDGRAGLEAVRARRPDLMLLDIRMPVMDGIETLKALRQVDKDLPVMMISGADDPHLARLAMRLGACDYISKPFDLNYLETTLLGKLATVAGDGAGPRGGGDPDGER